MRAISLLSCFVSLSMFAVAQQSPVDQRIAAARAAVASTKAGFDAYNDLAASLCRKGRDTGDVSVYDEAAKALQKSMALSANNYDALRLRVGVLIGEHQYQEALKLAQQLNKKAPDDIIVWGLLVDAHSALGNYSEAERCAQWVLDLRRASALGFEKAADLRILFGDAEGSAQFYDEAFTRTAQSDPDQRAFLLTQKARVLLDSGDARGAAAALDKAFALFPSSQLASLVKGDLETAKGNYPQAASIFEKCYQAVPSTQNLYRWAKSLDLAGDKNAAEQQFAAFEKQARAQISLDFNANLELVYFDIDQKHDAREAVRIAKLEAARRPDCHTRAALAWALYSNAEFSEAKTEMDKALAVGIRDATYMCRSAQINAKAAGTGVDSHACAAPIHNMQASLGDSQ